MRTQPHPQTRANVRVKTAALRNSRHHRYRISSRILESTTQRHANSREGRSGWVPGRQPLAQAGRGGAAARGREVGGAAAVIVHCHSGSLRFCCGAVAGGRWCVRRCARAAVGPAGRGRAAWPRGALVAGAPVSFGRSTGAGAGSSADRGGPYGPLLLSRAHRSKSLTGRPITTSSLAFWAQFPGRWLPALCLADTSLGQRSMVRGP